MKTFAYCCIMVLFRVHFLCSMAGGSKLPLVKEKEAQPLAVIQRKLQEKYRKQQEADDQSWLARSFGERMEWLEQNYKSIDSNILDAVLRRINMLRLRIPENRFTKGTHERLSAMETYAAMKAAALVEDEVCGGGGIY